MKRIAFLAVVVVLFCGYQEVEAQDLFICAIDIEQADKMLAQNRAEELFSVLQGRQKDQFNPGNAAGAAFLFACPREEAVVEIKWIAPKKEIQPFVKVIKCQGHYAIITWYVLDATVIGGILGESNAGRWTVQANLNGKLLAERNFELKRRSP